VTHFIDTNILIYSISDDNADTRKRKLAEELLDRDDGAISVQVLQEFYVQITRPSRPRRLSHGDAVALINAWQRFQVQDMTRAVLQDALSIKARYGFSYWDCAIIAAARALGCRTIYTEDLQHGQMVEAMTVINPFL
jgi:predicted nucleic acid-binding protein